MQKAKVYLERLKEAGTTADLGPVPKKVAGLVKEPGKKQKKKHRDKKS